MKREQEITLHDPTERNAPLVGKVWIPPKELVEKTERHFTFKSIPNKQGSYQYALRTSPEGDDILRADVHSNERVFVLTWDLKDGFSHDDFFAGIQGYCALIGTDVEPRGALLLPKLDSMWDFEGTLTRSDLVAEGVDIDQHPYVRVGTDQGDFSFDLTYREMGLFGALHPHNPRVLTQAASGYISSSGIDLSQQTASDLLTRVLLEANQPNGKKD